MFLLHDFPPLLEGVMEEVKLTLHQLITTFDIVEKMWPPVHRDLWYILNGERAVPRVIRIADEQIVVKKLLVKYIVETQGLTIQQRQDNQQSELRELYRLLVFAE